MSKIRLTPNASGTGTVTLTVPSTNTNRTISLPDAAGDVVTTGDSGTVVTNMIADSNITTDKIANANITPAKLNGGQSGSAPIFGVRAHCLFNGGGAVSVTGGGNVSSITDLGTGNYRVNFTTAMPSTAFSYAVSTRHQGGVTRGFIVEKNAGRSASYFEMEQYDLPDNNNGNYSPKDCDRIGVIIVHQ